MPQLLARVIKNAAGSTNALTLHINFNGSTAETFLAKQ
jgi:hypothetical protein